MFELESRVRCVEGALHGLPEGTCFLPYTRVRSGYGLPPAQVPKAVRVQTCENPVEQNFVALTPGAGLAFPLNGCGGRI